MPFDLAAFENVLVAALGGLAVGIEREWSGKAVGPRARFAGLRTFTLLGLVAGLSGWLWTAGLTGPALVFLAGLGALVVVAYQAASRTDVDGTTEVSAFVVLAAGVLAGAGYDRVASAIIAVTVLLLVEKKQLHKLVRRLDVVEIRAGVRFAVMAAVILPLLPVGPYGPYGGVRPRQLWELVLFFSGLSFIGYLAKRAVGSSKGYALTGLLGGIVSSTSVTLAFSRLSRSQAAIGRSLAAGVMGANVMVFPRVLIASLVMAPAMGRAIWPAFLAPAVVGLILMWTGIRDRPERGRVPAEKPDDNPLQVRAALQMALVFQLVLFAVGFAQSRYGNSGLTGSAALLGTVDVDALTLSMARMTSTGVAAADAAARALVLGILVNTVVKLGIALAVGRGRFRPLAGIGLTLIAIALGAWLLK